VGVPRLSVGRVAQDSADQRSGRAGRTRPGVAKRLWTASRHRLLPAQEEPEVHRADLAPAVLLLLAWGESDPADFPWLAPPSEAALDRAVALLRSLGAIDVGPAPGGGVDAAVKRNTALRLTPVGHALAALPVHPRLGRLLLEGNERGVPRRAALVAALLAERSPFAPIDGPAPHESDSDVLDRVEALEQFEARRSPRPEVGALRRGPAQQVLRARDQLAQVLAGGARDRIRGDSADDALLRCLFAAFADRLARRREPGGRRAVLRDGRGVRLDDQSAVREPELFVCVDIDAGRRGERAEARVRLASAVMRDWIDPAAIGSITRRTFDPERQRVSAVRETRLDALVLASVPAPAPADEETAAILAAAARAAPSEALGLDHPDAAGLRARVAFLRGCMPELGLPELDDASIAAELPRLCAGCTSFEELRAQGPVHMLTTLLTHEQLRALDRHAPERMEVPSGSRIRLAYQGDRAPVLAARIQELYGLRATPRVAAGRVPVLLHLLAPNHRPQQVTDDLESFWNTA
jgi:ATP-dependent helicase HrpB